MNAVGSLARGLALAVLLVLGVPALAHQLSGRVVAVADGDTITVLDADLRQHRVRLAGIDAPEKRQAFGTQSRKSLANKVFRRQVRIEFTKRDRFGRIVGKVFSAEGDVGLGQLKAGLAWHYRAYARQQTQTDRHAYSVAEAHARRARRGLWTETAPRPPWVFRRARPAHEGSGR